MQLTDQEYGYLETYRAVLQLLNNEVTLNWQRLYNSLVANSIIIAAWALILTQTNGPPLKGLLIAISVFGFLLTVLWVSATCTGNAYHAYWLLWLNFLENNLYKDGTRPVVHDLFHKILLLRGKTKTVRIDSPDQPTDRQFYFWRNFLKNLRKPSRLPAQLFRSLIPHISYSEHLIQMPDIPGIAVMGYFALVSLLFLIIYLVLIYFSFYHQP